MTLEEIDRVRLPEHVGEGAFGDADYFAADSRIFVAHPANHEVDIVDLSSRCYDGFVGPLPGVTGVSVCEERGLLLTANLGEGTIAWFELPTYRELGRVPVRERPRGLLMEPDRQRVLVATEGGDPGIAPTLTLYDPEGLEKKGVTTLTAPAADLLYARGIDAFLAAVPGQGQVLSIESEARRTPEVLCHLEGHGPRELALGSEDPGVLYCGCDDGSLFEIDLGKRVPHRLRGPGGGAIEALQLDADRRRLYVARGSGRGSLEALELGSGTTPKELSRVTTEAGARTMVLDAARREVHLFLPKAHVDLVLRDY